MNKLIEIIIFTILLNSCGAMAKDKACEVVLDTCRVVVTEQDTYITMLKGQVKDLEKKVSSEPVFPWWGWLGVGIISSMAVRGLVK